MKKISFVISSFILVVSTCLYFLSSCKKEDNYGLTLIQQEIPDGFPPPVYNFSGNGLSIQGFELGRKLFYDTRLSADGQVSCGSCHEQRAAFGTFEHDRSHGVFHSHTLRNAPVLVNLAWNKSFDWDGLSSSLVNEASYKIHESTVFGETIENVIAKLESVPAYREDFEKVFGSPVITPVKVYKAIAQFSASLVSANSKYDKVKKGLQVFTAQEDRGYQVFKTKCATCHTEPLFTDQTFRNTGIPVDDLLKDYGRMRVTGKPEDSLKFKVPTLRNVAVSSNYMHDGRFGTLFQVLNHYRMGVQQSPTLDPLLTNGIALTSADVNDLVVFLRTLTDSAFLNDVRYRSPF
jgi:cytochrome c peroxidase